MSEKSTERAGRGKRWWRWAGAAAALVMLAPFPIRLVARHFLFPAHRARALEMPSSLDPASTRAKDGTAVNTLFSPAPSARAPVVVVFHGNAETMAHSAWLADALRERGLGSMLVEYRGYGRSAEVGPPSEEGLYQDAEAALDLLRARGVERERVVLFGFSLGSGVAAEMARRGRAAALVLVAPFTSVPDVVTDVVPLLPVRLLMTERFDTLSKVNDIHVPTLVIHGSDDEVVPFWMGETLAARLRGAHLIAVPRGRHGDLFARERERLLAAIVSLSPKA